MDVVSNDAMTLGVALNSLNRWEILKRCSGSNSYTLDVRTVSAAWHMNKGVVSSLKPLE